MKILTMISVLSLGVLIHSGCSNRSGDSQQKTETVNKEALKLTEGKEKFTAYCSSCHSQQAEEGARLAPPAFALQKRYTKAYEEELAFASAITDFVHQPSEEKALMKDAVEKFGLMPPMGYSEEDLKAIAYYIYHGTFTKGRQNHGSQVSSPLAIGKQIAMGTKKALGKQLMGAINEAGTAHAFAFCNTRAIPLTDSMAQELNAQIKRVSDKPRNPNNIASAEELTIISQYQEQLVAGKQPAPMIQEEGEGYRYYGPITTNALCLQCHGNTGSDINPETTRKINELYPDDQATGYDLNELRGIWSIYFTEPATQL